MNKIFLVGNVGKDVTCSTSQSGKEYAFVAVAVSERRADKPDEYDTTWFDVTVFGASAKWSGENLRKGCKVFVTGRLKAHEYTAKDGSKQKGMKLLADSIDLVRPAKEAAQYGAHEATKVEETRPRGFSDVAAGRHSFDDIPF